MLRPGDTVPDFDVRAVDGSQARYDTLWQRRNLLLVALPDVTSETNAAYLAALSARMPELTAHETACIISSDPIPGVPSPGVLIADRWGEIHHVADGASTADLPDAVALIEWLRYVQYQCPECQGETK